MAQRDTRRAAFAQRIDGRRTGTEPAWVALMRLRSTLMDIAAIAVSAIASAGCGGRVVGTFSPSLDAAAPGAAGKGPIMQGGGQELDGPMAEGSVTADGEQQGDSDVAVEAGDALGQACTSASGTMIPESACALVEQDRVFGSAGVGVDNVVFGSRCDAFCGSLCPGVGPVYVGYWRCQLPQSYVDAYHGVQPEAGVSDGAVEAGPDAGFMCPHWSGRVLIQCQSPPIGRRTESAGARPCEAPAGSLGAQLAERAYLESVSVHAFSTLERELDAHGAPAVLLRDVRRARRDEVRHTAMMTRLARRFGGALRRFESRAPAPVRGLLAIAMENVTEGCVRETYGAVVALIESRISRDPQVRRTMHSIAADECRHAELAWAVAAWVRPRLTAEERRRVDRALRETVAELRQEDDARIVELLVERVWAGSNPA